MERDAKGQFVPMYKGQFVPISEEKATRHTMFLKVEARSTLNPWLSGRLYIMKECLNLCDPYRVKGFELTGEKLYKDWGVQSSQYAGYRNCDFSIKVGVGSDGYSEVDVFIHKLINVIASAQRSQIIPAFIM